MQKYQSIISGTNGSVIRNVPVTVLKEDGSLAEIFLDREGQVPAPNPLATDSRGVFYFYAKNGRYSLRTSVDGITITDADAVLLNDPEEIATAGPIADAVIRAEAAAQRAEFAVEASGIPDLVSQAQNAVLDANAALQGAQSAAQLAEDAKAQAASAKNAAELAQQASDTAKTGAENARSLAEQAANQARVYAESIDPAQFVQKEAGKGLMTDTERTKLSGIAEQATKNAADAELRDRSTHTGTQAVSTIEGLAESLIAVANRANHTGEQSIATVAGLPVVLPSLVKVEPSLPCLIKTSGTTIAIKAGTHVKIGSAYVSFTAQTAVSMPAVLTPGEDYAVFVHPDGAASAVADPFYAPAAAPVTGALKIGGFHYGLVAPGTTPASGGFATTGFTNAGGNYPWTQARVDRIAGINEFSIWDLSFMSKGEQRGFAFDPQTRVWSAVYFCGPDHITSGISRYNTAVASGTVLPKIPVEYGGDGTTTYGRLSAYEALEILASHGCRLMTQEEFASGALGVTEGQSLGGAASTIPATKREPGYTSRIGLEQATGHVWTIGGPLTSVGGSAWTPGPNRGNFYGETGLPVFGGHRTIAANSGSRASYWNSVFWYSGWDIGLRAACDHYQGA